MGVACGSLDSLFLFNRLITSIDRSSWGYFPFPETVLNKFLSLSIHLPSQFFSSNLHLVEDHICLLGPIIRFKYSSRRLFLHDLPYLQFDSLSACLIVRLVFFSFLLALHQPSACLTRHILEVCDVGLTPDLCHARHYIRLVYRYFTARDRRDRRQACITAAYKQTNLVELDLFFFFFFFLSSPSLRFAICFSSFFPPCSHLAVVLFLVNSFFSILHFSSVPFPAIVSSHLSSFHLDLLVVHWIFLVHPSASG